MRVDRRADDGHVGAARGDQLGAAREPRDAVREVIGRGRMRIRHRDELHRALVVQAAALREVPATVATGSDEGETRTSHAETSGWVRVSRAATTSSSAASSGAPSITTTARSRSRGAPRSTARRDCAAIAGPKPT